jgi:type IV secretion system protein VirD4
LNKVGKIAVVSAVALAAGLYLSGYFFLFVNHQNPRQTTPLTILQYGQYYGDNPAFRKSLIGSSATGFGIVSIFALLLLIPRNRALHGEAKFATTQDIKKRGLLGGEGILLGQLNGKYLTLPGQQGAILSAPPRAGKGVGVVVPNLLNFPGSVIVVDIKRENWTITAGFRQKHGQHVFLFDPLSETGETACWNPLFYVSNDSNIRINDIQRIAEMLYMVDTGKDPFWALNSRKLFLGIALYLFETLHTTRTLGEVLRQAMSGGTTGEGFVAHWKRIIGGRRSGKQRLSWQCEAAIYEVIDLAPQTASGIRSEFTSKLSLWLNPLLDAATSSNDFDLRDLRKKPMSIYVGVTPDNLDRIRPVLSLFFQQAIGLQTRELPEQNPQLKHQLLLMLDEFTSLGRIPIIETSCGYLPGYNIRIMLVIQTPSQLRSVYGRDGADTIIKTLAGRILFAPKDFADAQEISNELGSTTVKGKSRSRPMWGSGKGNSTTESDQRRMLLLPQEVKELGDDKEIIIYEGIRPILAEKIIYYQDKNFKNRLLRPPEVKRITPVSGHQTTSSYEDTSLEGQGNIIYRPMTLDDIENIDNLPLTVFSLDLESIIPRTGQPLEGEEIKAAAQRYLNYQIES